jgi:hypothetical protein
MPKELSGLSDKGIIITSVPNGEELPCIYGQEDRITKTTWEGRDDGAQPNEDAI